MRENYLEKIFQSKIPQIIMIIAILLALIVVAYNITIYYLQKKVETSYTNLQNECEIQAKNFTNNLQNTINSIQYTYTSHYHIGLKKCYIVIHGQGVANTGTSDKLVDLLENNDIAECESYATAPELNYCKYLGSKSIYSVKNFKDFTRSYMETE